MKNSVFISFVLVFVLITNMLIAQNVAISDDGNYTAHNSAMLDVKSTSKGLLIPRLTKVQRDNILSPATGLLLFQTDSTPGFYFYNGGELKSTWEYLSSSLDDLWKRDDVNGYTYLSNNTDAVGIGTSSPDATLHVDGDDGLIATGTFNSGQNLSVSGQGTRLVWYPKKAAFRAGEIDNDQWDDGNIGNYSVAMGASTKASGAHSVVCGGLFNEATGPFSTVTGGELNTAGGSHSWAGGRFMQLTAGANHSFVWGYSENFFPTMIPTPNAFIIFPEEEGGFHGQVGIGTMFPSEHLDVVGTVKVGGLKMPVGAVPGFVLTSDPNGKATWQPVPVLGIDGSGTSNYIPKFTGTQQIGNSEIYEDGNNNIGIGTTVPQEKLDVSGKLSMGDNIRLNDNWLSGDGDNEGIYVFSNGKVGIGTSSPSEVLDVNGKLHLRDNIKLNGHWLTGDGDGEGVFVSSTGKVGINTSGPSESLDVYGNLNMQGNILLNSNWLSGDGGIEGIYINDTGSVGIGTSSPVEKLDVTGKLHMRDNIKLNTHWLSGDGDNEGVYVNTTGNVGIGTSTPGKKLEVNGNVKVDGELLVSKDNVTISSSGSKITLQAYNTKITIDETGGITIESDNDINISADGNLYLTGDNVNITAQQDLDISVGGNMDVTASNDIDVTASNNIDVNAGLSLDLSCNLQLWLQSGLTANIRSNSILDLRAPLVKINGQIGARPAARVDDLVNCPPGGGIGIITTGSPTVLIGN
ncbi:MAG: hypothetical protein H8D45_19615 [Bacteroidetes bacterium]|nr:hypothetical protein [Bacteroidota bacterium]